MILDSISASLLKFFYENGIYYTLFKERSVPFVNGETIDNKIISANLVCDKNREEIWLSNDSIVITSSLQEGLTSYITCKNVSTLKNSIQYNFKYNKEGGAYTFGTSLGSSSTIAMVFRTDCTSSNYLMRIHSDYNIFSMRIGGSAEGYKFIVQDKSISTLLSSSTQYNDNKWHILIVTISNLKMTIYIDGVNIGNFTHNDLTSVVKLDIAGRGSGDRVFDGDLAMVLVKPYSSFGLNQIKQLNYCIDRYLHLYQLFVEADEVYRDIKYIKRTSKIPNYRFYNNSSAIYEFFPLNNTYKSINNVTPINVSTEIEDTEYRTDNFVYDYNLKKTILRTYGKILEYNLGFTNDLTFFIKFKLTKSVNSEYIFQLKDTNGKEIYCTLGNTNNLKIEFDGVLYESNYVIELNTWYSLTFLMSRIIIFINRA